MNNTAARLAAESMVSDPSRRCVPFVGLYGATSMTKKTYFEKLKDPRWQKKRLEALDTYGWACEWCQDNSKTLHVHHKTYLKGREPWEYDVQQLAVLCEDCHETWHESDPLLEVISRLPMDGPNSRTQMAMVMAGALGLYMKFECVGDAIHYLCGAGISRQWDKLYSDSKIPGSATAKFIALEVDQTQDD